MDILYNIRDSELPITKAELFYMGSVSHNATRYSQNLLYIHTFRYPKTMYNRSLYLLYLSTNSIGEINAYTRSPKYLIYLSVSDIIKNTQLSNYISFILIWKLGNEITYYVSNYDTYKLLEKINNLFNPVKLLSYPDEW
jgi:hypothetical protein